jgi:aconitate hydratase
MLLSLVKLVIEVALLLLSGMLAKKAVEAGLSVAPYIKTSLSPGSGVVSYYLQESGVLPFLELLGFNNVGYGCMTCIGNSGPLPDNMVDAIEKVYYNFLHPKL